MANKDCEFRYSNCTNRQVKKITDPYDLEINGRVTKVHACPECEQERHNDI